MMLNLYKVFFENRLPEQYAQHRDAVKAYGSSNDSYAIVHNGKTLVERKRSVAIMEIIYSTLTGEYRLLEAVHNHVIEDMVDTALRLSPKNYMPEYIRYTSMGKVVTLNLFANNQPVESIDWMFAKE